VTGRIGPGLVGEVMVPVRGGIEDMLAKALTLGGTGLGVARQLLSSMNGQSAANGRPTAPTLTADTDSASLADH
jgi:flotillin